MKVRQINLDDDGEGLESVVVTMDAREVHLVAAMMGSTTGIRRDALSPGGGESGSNIYSALSSVANMFYENGLSDMATHI